MIVKCRLPRRIRQRSVYFRVGFDKDASRSVEVGVGLVRDLSLTALLIVKCRLPRRIRQRSVYFRVGFDKADGMVPIDRRIRQEV